VKQLTIMSAAVTMLWHCHAVTA